MPTQPPCCQTLQTSHCRKKPATSSGTSAAKKGSMSAASLEGFFVSSLSTGGPGYSSKPQMQRTDSSSSCISFSLEAMSALSALAAAALSRSLLLPSLARLRKVRTTVSVPFTLASSGGSEADVEGAGVVS